MPLLANSTTSCSISAGPRRRFTTTFGFSFIPQLQHRFPSLQRWIGRTLTVDHYMQVQWGNSGLRIIFVERYDEIPGLLRDIQWGETPKGLIPRWTNEGIKWRSQRLRDSVIFTDAWQQIGHKSLHELVAKVNHLFGVPANEKLNAAMFIPFSESESQSRLRLVASSRKVAGAEIALERAIARVLSIAKGEE